VAETYRRNARLESTEADGLVLTVGIVEEMNFSIDFPYYDVYDYRSVKLNNYD
jgi:hypothetical protein